MTEQDAHQRGDEGIEWHWEMGIAKHGWDSLYVTIERKGSREKLWISYTLLEYILKDAL